MIRSTIGSLLNNTFIRPLLVWLHLDYSAARFRNNWAGKTLDTAKSLQQNMGFSERPEIQQALDCAHEALKGVYARYGNGGAALDVGCGVGLYLSDFPETAELHGIDVSVNYLATAKQRLPKATFHHGDFLEKAFPLRFSLIYSVGVLQYIPPSRVPALVSKIEADLVPGGAAFIHYPLAVSEVDCLSPDLTYVQYSPAFLEQEFAKVFEIVSHTHASDGRSLDFQYDSVRYDPEMTRSFRNCGILLARKKLR